MLYIVKCKICPSSAVVAVPVGAYCTECGAPMYTVECHEPKRSSAQKFVQALDDFDKKLEEGVDDPYVTVQRRAKHWVVLVIMYDPHTGTWEPWERLPIEFPDYEQAVAHAKKWAEEKCYEFKEVA